MRNIILFISLLSNVFQYKKHQDQRRARRSDHEANGVKELVRLPDVINIRWHPDEHERQRQQEGFKWTKDGPTWVGTIFAIFAFIISSCAFDEARKTTKEIATQTHIAQDAQRPWLLFDTLTSEGPLQVRDGIVSIVTRAVVKNYSANPAIKAAFVSEIMPLNPGVSYPTDKVRRFCSSWGELPGDTVGASQSSTEQRWTASVEFNKIIPIKTPQGEFVYNIAIVACEQYSGLDGKKHFTGIIRHLYDLKTTLLFQRNGSIFSDQVFIENRDLFMGIPYVD